MTHMACPRQSGITSLNCTPHIWNIEMDPCGPASGQDFFDSIHSEGVGEKVVDPMQHRKFKPLHHLFHCPPVIFGLVT